MDKTNPLQPAMGLPIMYNCNNCKYSGYHFPEVEISKLNKLKPGKVIKETHQINTAYGDFYIRVMWKIFSPVVLLIGLYLLFYKDIPTGIIFTLLGMFTFYIAFFKKRKLSD